MNDKIGAQIIRTAKQTAKANQSSKNSVIRLGVLILVVMWNAVKNSKRLCVDSNYRSIIFLKLLYSKDVHQTTPMTSINRYPSIFSACQEYFDEKRTQRILSFGCSTGEEVLTLREYFPTAQLIGADINKRNLAICKKLPVDEKINFIYSTPTEIKKYGRFDAIFCMAVLQ